MMLNRFFLMVSECGFNKFDFNLFFLRLKKASGWFGQLFLMSAFLIVPRLVLADGDTPVSEGLGYLVSAMYGSTGVVIATLAVIVVGLLCLSHVLEWKRLFQTVIGVAIIFGAGAIVSGIQSLVSNN